MTKLRVAVMASGGGSNLQQLLDRFPDRDDSPAPARVCLVLADKPGIGALERAARAGVRAEVVPPAQFATPQEFGARLLSLLCEERIGLVVLAGYLRLLPTDLVAAYRNRIINIHPALLPAFGGKGMYGHHVHEAVLRAGERRSGCTVHWVDADYDRGAIIARREVPVLPGDTPESLAARVLEQEHRLLPEVVAGIAEGKVRPEGIDEQPDRTQCGCGLKQPGMRVPMSDPQVIKIRRALLSVSDKRGVVELARALRGYGAELLSTGGTARHLAENGVELRTIDDFTGHPEILDGRVKTLHPKVHAALLARRELPEHMEQCRRLGVELIDLVVVNLYPFEQTVARQGVSLEEAVEQIDIGGPTMLRSAAKNFTAVAVVTSADQYPMVIEQLRKNDGGTDYQTRYQLARAVFERTSAYDSRIAAYLREQAPRDQA